MVASSNWFPILMMLLGSILFANASSPRCVPASFVSSTIAYVSVNATATPVSVSTPTSSTGSHPDRHEVAPWCQFAQGQSYKGYVMHCGLDFCLGDLSNKRVKDFDKCVGLCNVTSGCSAMSYQAESDDGLNGMCWLKDNIASFQRANRWILGMHRVDVPYTLPSWFHPPGRASSMVAPSSPVWTPSASNSPKSVSVTTHSSTVTSFSKPSPAASSNVALSSPASKLSSTTPVVKTSSYNSVSSATTRSPLVTSSSKPSFTADQGASGGSTSIGPPFWFSSAHPCYPTDCSFPVTRSYPSLSISWVQQSSKVAPLSSKVTLTKSVVTTKVFTSSKASVTKSFFKTSASTSTRYSKPSRTGTSVYGRPSSTSSAYSSPPVVSSGYVPLSSSRLTSSVHRPSSSSKGYVVSSSVFSVYLQPSTKASSRLSSHSSGRSSSTATRSSSSSKDYAVSTVSQTTVTTRILVSGTTTSTVYKPVPTWSSTTPVVSSATTTSTVYKPVTSKSSVTSIRSSGILSHSTTFTSYTVVIPTRSSTVMAPSSAQIWTTPVPTRPFTTTVSSSAWIMTVPVPIRESSVVSMISVTDHTPSAETTATSLTVSKAYVTVSSSQGYGYTVVTSATGSRLASSGHVGSSSVASSHSAVPFPSASGSLTPITSSMVHVTASSSWNTGAHSSSDITSSPIPTSFVTPSISGSHIPITKSVTAVGSFKATPNPSSESSGSSRLIFSSSFGITVVFAFLLLMPFAVW
ncbi:hypothetical protein BU25DRAFT_488568 [Macroventuria anomochaeta]|uniref:Uncharacterized protein n=1 Tax=Macroventuria anomochaeta TaxID=301207 RepID=A0ACB6SCR6_9PLEO|nr:uncharacterized protein BU25DRAFT_488568 [Macroventuria anomochaeta]KAF2631133.1 hypothetical protein BU25DRAFT_488568 [Macroventuria anomochaeta]